MKTSRSDQFKTMLGFSVRSLLFQELLFNDEDISTIEIIEVTSIQAMSINLVSSRLSPKHFEDNKKYNDLMMWIANQLMVIAGEVQQKVMDYSNLDRQVALNILSCQDGTYQEFDSWFANMLEEQSQVICDKLDWYTQPMEN